MSENINLIQKTTIFNFVKNEKTKWIRGKGIQITYAPLHEKFYATTKWYRSEEPNEDGSYLMKMTDDRQDVTEQIENVIADRERWIEKLKNIK